MNPKINCLAALLLLPLTALYAAEAPKTPRPVQVIELRPDDVTTMVSKRGELAGGVVTIDVAVANFTSPKSTVTWLVKAPKEDDYAVGVIFSNPTSEKLEVCCGDSVLTAPSLPRTWKSRPFFWRQELPGLLHLKAGMNRVTFRAPYATAPVPTEQKDCYNLTKVFTLWSIELGTPAARQAQLKRAKEIRGDASWMIQGKYGLFVHWSPLIYAVDGTAPMAQWHQKAVEMFDVKVFADAVERTGASWMLFTLTHGEFYWPGPSAAVDKILPGRTTKRDLIGEIIEELDRRGIRTLFYLHNCVNGREDPRWAKAVGALDADTKQFGDNIEAILRESSLRYGKKLNGYGYIDCSFYNDYPLDPPWERWARAIKAGNPAAVVGFSAQRGPTVSPFSELAVTDGHTKLGAPDRTVIGPGQQFGDVTPAWWFAMDGWRVRGKMTKEIGNGPTASTAEYVEYFRRMAAERIPVTINLAITADVTNQHPIFNEKCMAAMEQVRKAIRGK